MELSRTFSQSHQCVYRCRRVNVLWCYSGVTFVPLEDMPKSEHLIPVTDLIWK